MNNQDIDCVDHVFLDIFIAIVILASTIIAFMRGFIREALTLVTIGLTLIITYWGAPLLIPLMDNWMQVGENSEKIFGILPREFASLTASYASIFLTLIISFTVASHMLAEFIKSIGLGSVDRSLGALFGVVRGILLMAVIYMPFHFLLDQDTKDSWFKNSKSYVYLEQSSSALATMLPTDMIKEKAQASDEENTTASSAKEKLQALQVLKDSLDDEDVKNLMEKAISNDETSEKGYNDDFRGEINTLFEQNADNFKVNE